MFECRAGKISPTTANPYYYKWHEYSVFGYFLQSYTTSTLFSQTFNEYTLIMKEYSSWALWIFNATYLFWGTAYFLQDLNFEFVIYVGVIVLLLAAVLLTTSQTEFPQWMLWLFSLWGLLHVLGGAVKTSTGVLFGQHIYTFINRGGDFYVLKYDQIVHFYLYGLIGIMAYHLLRRILAVKDNTKLTILFAIMASLGISALNEIMEFLISVVIAQNGVGGYENSMLDLIFNLFGASVAVTTYHFCCMRTKR